MQGGGPRGRAHPHHLLVLHGDVGQHRLQHAASLAAGVAPRRRLEVGERRRAPPRPLPHCRQGRDGSLPG